MTETFLNARVIITVGSIIDQKVDAIVNAANSTLLGGGGVDGAIHDAGGRQIYAECERIRQTDYPKGLPTGQAVITTAGNLPAKFVIHTLGPVYGMAGGQEANLLAHCYQNSLSVAAKHGLKTIAFPSISTGAFGYPKHEAARISSAAIKDFLENSDAFEEIRLIFFDIGDARKFLKHHKF